MSFWKSLFSKPIKTGDAFFGEMRFMEDAACPAKSYFECQCYFAPSSELIELHITAELSGPTRQQKEFFTWVEQEYARLTVKLAPLIELRFGTWLIPSAVIQDFIAEFKPIFLCIPACNQQPIEWEIVFDRVPEANYCIAVSMLGDEPQYVRIDD